MKIDATKERFELIDMDGYQCLFTNMRVDRNTVPEGLYCYDVRDADCDGTFAEVQPFVLVNHWGTIITKEEIPMDEYGSYIPKNDEPGYLCDMTIEEFQKEGLDSKIKNVRGVHNQEYERTKMDVEVER